MILFVASDYIPHTGGKSSHVMDLMSGLSDMGVDSFVFSKKQISELRIKAVLAVLRPFKWINDNLYVYMISSWWKNVLAKNVLALYKKYTPECISFQDAFAAAALCKYKSKISCRTALTMHTYFGLENKLDKKAGRITESVYRKQLDFELKALETVDKIIAVDDRIKKHVIDAVENYPSKDRVTVKNVTSIENFTNIDLFSPTDADKKPELREQFGIKGDKIVLNCIRRLVEKNGVIFAVKAMQYLDDDYVLLVGGRGPQEQEIKDFISDNGLSEKVIMLGNISSETARKVYAASDISLVPSITVNGLQEATSISAIEAMSCGLPVVASSIGGLKQMITDRENGMLVDEGDEKQIAKAVSELKDNTLYRSISQNARTSVENNYSHINGAKKYYSEFTADA